MAGAAIVSGGSRGLGLVLVERLLASGRAVATFSRTGSEALDQLKTRYGSRLQAAEVDAADSHAVRQFVAMAADQCDGLDVCVANAGHAVPGMLATASDEAIEAVLAINLRGAIVLVREVVRQMLADTIRATSPPAAAGGSLMGGFTAGAEASGTAHRDRSIVFVSSAVATRGSTGLAVYAATKAGLEGFARSLARELGPRRIRVNAVAPGFFASDLSASLGDEARQRIIRRTALGRLATAADVAGTIEFLIGPQAALITGQVVAVDGGAG
jgi:3-oxoacyl-[acyl-carrier protein] reductase